MTTNQIIWHQLQGESPENRIDRLNAALHRIFFEGRVVCPDSFLDIDATNHFTCRVCNAREIWTLGIKHSTPRFLESLDAMQLIVESGKFAEVREEFFHWLSKEQHECIILLYEKNHGRTRFTAKGKSRQDAFYGAALRAMGYTVVQEKQGENNL